MKVLALLDNGLRFYLSEFICNPFNNKAYLVKVDFDSKRVDIHFTFRHYRKINYVSK